MRSQSNVSPGANHIAVCSDYIPTDIENMVEPSAQPAVYGSNQNSLLNNAPAMNKDYLGMASLLFVAVALAF